MNFIDFLQESLDSYYKIQKQEIGNFGAELFYIDVNDKEYRIFVEEVDKELHIGFERKIDNNFKLTPITNDLSTKEILGLFGTILRILKGRNFTAVFIETDNAKKNQMYFNMMTKLNRELKFNFSRNDTSILLYKGEHIPNIKDKFRYKKLFN